MADPTPLHELRELVRCAQHHIPRDWPQANEWLQRALEALGSEDAHQGTGELAPRAKSFQVTVDHLLGVQLLKATGFVLDPPAARLPELATNQDDAPCCPACGSMNLRYHENVPTTRDILDIRDGTVWVNSDDEDHWWEASYGDCLDCEDCCTKIRPPEGHDYEWNLQDYGSRFGFDELAKARKRRGI